MAIVHITTPGKTTISGLNFVSAEIEADDQGYQGQVTVDVGKETSAVDVLIPPHSVLRLRKNISSSSGSVAVRYSAGGKTAEALIEN